MGQLDPRIDKRYPFDLQFREGERVVHNIPADTVFGMIYLSGSYTVTLGSGAAGGVVNPFGPNAIVQQLEIAGAGRVQSIKSMMGPLFAWKEQRHRGTHDDFVDTALVNTASSVTTYRWFIPVRFMLMDDPSKFETLFKTRGLGSPQLIITWATANQLVAGGTYSEKTITWCTGELNTLEFPFADVSDNAPQFLEVLSGSLRGQTVAAGSLHNIDLLRQGTLKQLHLLVRDTNGLVVPAPIAALVRRIRLIGDNNKVYVDVGGAGLSGEWSIIQQERCRHGMDGNNAGLGTAEHPGWYTIRCADWVGAGIQSHSLNSLRLEVTGAGADTVIDFEVYADTVI